MGIRDWVVEGVQIVKIVKVVEIVEIEKGYLSPVHPASWAH
jgi:hypothetical protein